MTNICNLRDLTLNTLTNNTLNVGEVVFLQDEEEEEDLVTEEETLYAIIMDILDIFQELHKSYDDLFVL